MNVAREWQEKHGPLAPKERLVPKRFFVTGGEYAISNLLKADGAKGMRIRGPIAQQIHDLPYGAQIELRVTE